MTENISEDMNELFPVDPHILDNLHKKLEVEADRLGLISLAYRTIDTPVGQLLLVSTVQGLVRVGFEIEGFETVLQDLARKISPRIVYSASKLDTFANQLDEYFRGKRRTFTLPLDHSLSSGFRLKVQKYLPFIPYGSTLSYQEVAQKVENPKAFRAVGTACATNPLAIIVPCHRVLRTDGSLGGYAGGLDMKTHLLALERADIAEI